MMRSLMRSFLAAPAVVGVLAALVAIQSATAQTRESTVYQHVTDDVVLLVNLNVETAMAAIDREAEDYRYMTRFLTDEVQFPLDTLSLIQLTFELPEHFGENDDFGDLVCVQMQWQRAIDHDALIRSMISWEMDSYQETELEGRPFYRHVGTWNQPSILVPDDDRILIGMEDRLRSALTGIEDNTSPGGRLAQEIDTERQLQVLLDLRHVSDEGMRAEFLQEFTNGFAGPMGPGGLGAETGFQEIMASILYVNALIDFTHRESVLVTFETSDEDHAERLKSLLQTGLMMAPGSIDVARDEMNAAPGEFMTREIKESMEKVLDLAEAMVENTNVSREGNRVVLRVEQMGGFPDAPDAIVSAIAAQMRMVERMMEQFRDFDPDFGPDFGGPPVIIDEFNR